MKITEREAEILRSIRDGKKLEVPPKTYELAILYNKGLVSNLLEIPEDLDGARGVTVGLETKVTTVGLKLLEQ